MGETKNGKNSWSRLTSSCSSRYNHETFIKGSDILMSIDTVNNIFVNRRRERTGK